MGRGPEISELDAALSELCAGRGGVVLVSGEPGIGKTRLADELARRGAARGAVVHWGRAWEAGGAPPYWPFVQTLRSVCRSIEGPSLAELVGDDGPELGALVPEIRHRLPGLQALAAQDDRFRMFDAVCMFLRRVAERRPQILVLDDLHAADPSSLLLLSFLVRDLRAVPLLVLGTYRGAEAVISPEIGAALSRIAREATVLPLRALDRAEVNEFVTQSTGVAPATERLDAIYKRTEGNPLFLGELLRLQVTTGRQPEGIREVVRARLSLLTPDVRRVLEAASVLGREFWVDPLAAIAELSEESLRGMLSPALDVSIIEPLEPSGRWRFTHVLLREGLYDELSADQRASFHRAAASELRRRLGETPLAELAHHLMLAVPAVPASEAIDTVLLAAERSMQVLAFEDARALLARALRLVERGAPDTKLRMEVLLALGVARIRAGDVELGKRTCIDAASLARQLGDSERFARAVFGAACEFTPGIRNPELIALLEEALSMLPPGDGALRARCMAQLAAERQPEPDTGGPIELARGAVAMARRIGDKETLRFTLSFAGLAMMVYADPEERFALDQEALRLALAAGDKRVSLRTHLLLLTDHWERADLERAEAHSRSYRELAGEFAHGSFDWVSAAFHGAMALWKGDFDQAERLYRESSELARKDETRGTSLAALAPGVCCAMERYDDVASVENQVRAAFAPAGDLGACIGEMLIAQVHGRSGDRGQAAAQLDLLRSHPVFAAITEASWLALLTDACHLTDDVALSERIYAAVAPRAARLFTLGHLGPACEPPYARQVGLLAQTLGRVDEAVTHLAAAESTTARVGMRSHLARVRYELAGALLARGAPADRSRAAALLTDARALAVSLGQTRLVELIDARARGPEAEPPVAPPSKPPAFTISLRREGDVWAVSDGARTSRLRDSRGLRLLEQLLASPGQEFHVLQIVSPNDGVGDAGDAGTVLDSAAIVDYRTRLLELREELAEAERFADTGRAARAKSEAEFLTQELASAVGLGGRERRSGNAAERARTTVQKRLREAIRRIGDALPEIGAHLEQSVRTGTFVGYFPSGRARVRR